MINFIKISNTCKDCPYLKSPASDLGEQDQYHSCSLTYANTYDLDHFKEICPLKNIRAVLKDFVLYNAIAKGNAGLDYKKENQIINNFIEEKL